MTIIPVTLEIYLDPRCPATVVRGYVSDPRDLEEQAHVLVSKSCSKTVNQVLKLRVANFKPTVIRFVEIWYFWIS